MELASLPNCLLGSQLHEDDEVVGTRAKIPEILELADFSRSWLHGSK